MERKKPRRGNLGGFKKKKRRDTGDQRGPAIKNERMEMRESPQKG